MLLCFSVTAFATLALVQSVVAHINTVTTTALNANSALVSLAANPNALQAQAAADVRFDQSVLPCPID